MPLHIVRNDITKMQVDAIVNAANESLLGGGGVDGCIHRAAGPELLAECRTLGGCRMGQAKLTRGYRLPCRYVIHTVGPRWHGGTQGEPELLRACYQNALALAAAQGCETVAFPLISSGVFGYPKDKALQVAVDTIGAFLAGHEMTVYLVIFDRKAYQIGEALFADIAAYIDDRYVEEHTDSADLRRRRGEMFFDVWSGEAASDLISDEDEKLDEDASYEGAEPKEDTHQDEETGEAGKPEETDNTGALYEIDVLLQMLNLRADADESVQLPPAVPPAAASAASAPTEGSAEKKPTDVDAPPAAVKPSAAFPPPAAACSPGEVSPPAAACPSGAVPPPAAACSPGVVPPPANTLSTAARRKTGTPRDARKPAPISWKTKTSSAAPSAHTPQKTGEPVAAFPARTARTPGAPTVPAPASFSAAPPSMAPAAQPMLSLDEELLQLDESFSEMLLRKIDEAGITDAQCYKKANIDRKLFSKIRSDKRYRPSKPTALAFAIALELPLSETREMLEKAGFALSRSSKFDIIVEYFIRHGNYNVFEINEALFAFDQNLLGA